MNAEFNWWLLIVGLVLGASLTWLVMSDAARRDADVGEAERRSEALWIATVVTSAGRPVEADRVEEILRLHREYLAAPPPDDASVPALDPADPEPRSVASPAPRPPAPRTPPEEA